MSPWVPLFSTPIKGPKASFQKRQPQSVHHLAGPGHVPLRLFFGPAWREGGSLARPHAFREFRGNSQLLACWGDRQGMWLNEPRLWSPERKPPVGWFVGFIPKCSYLSHQQGGSGFEFHVCQPPCSSLPKARHTWNPRAEKVMYVVHFVRDPHLG